MHVQGRFAPESRYSVDVGAVFNKLFCKDELVHMGRIVERICQIGQHVESKVRLLVLEQHVGINELKITRSGLFGYTKASRRKRSEQEGKL
jgi:hypothetical protein